MRAIAVLLLPLAGCLSPASKTDPCPSGLCGDAGAQAPAASDGGACSPVWSCTPWLAQADGLYARTCIDGAHCGVSDGEPPVGPLPLPALDRDYFECRVEPILDRSCSMLACHGSATGRVLTIYARGRLRLDAGTATVVGVGSSPHTGAEWQANYDSARAFMLGVTDPDDSDLLQQPVFGGKAHAGVHLFGPTDADYLALRDWVSGKTLGAPCNPLPN